MLSFSTQLPLNSTLVDIANQLFKMDITALICAGMSNRLSLVDALSSLNPNLSFILIGDPQLQTTIHHSLNIEHFEDPETYISEQELLRTAEGILAYLPAGLDLPHTLDADLLFPLLQVGFRYIQTSQAICVNGWIQDHCSTSCRAIYPFAQHCKWCPTSIQYRPQHFFALRWLAKPA